MKFVNWEGRPAVISGGRAWAVLGPNEGWTEVEEAEVSDSGTLLDEATFSALFGTLPAPPAAASALP